MRGYYSHFGISTETREKLLETIIGYLQEYDSCLDRFAFTRRGFVELNQVLTRPVVGDGLLNPEYFKKPVNLCNPEGLRDLISEIDFSLGLDIRLWKNFPVYFLFRFKYDSYLQHYVLLEEIYLSKHYPFSGQRFLRLTSGYGERIFLNVMTYRSQIGHLIRGNMRRRNFDRKVNSTLDQVAEILNLAWDEDFELTRRMCHHLRIGHITEAMELTHLILNTEDFSWLRDRPEVIKDFFNKHYENPHLGLLLNRVSAMDNRQWLGMLDQARKDYLQLKLAVSKLFNVEIGSDAHRYPMPVWKYVLKYHEKEIPCFEASDQLKMIITSIERVAERIIHKIGAKPVHH